jgi:hypothetical protein
MLGFAKHWDFLFYKMSTQGIYYLYPSEIRKKVQYIIFNLIKKI